MDNNVLETVILCFHSEHVDPIGNWVDGLLRSVHEGVTLGFQFIPLHQLERLSWGSMVCKILLLLALISSNSCHWSAASRSS